MAAVLVPDDQPARRRAFVDTSRYDAVVGDFYDGTGAAAVGDDVELPGRGPPAAGHAGTTVSATAEAFPVRVPQTPPRAIGATQITLDYVTAAGSPGRAVLRLLGAPYGIVEASEPLDRCDEGCVVRGLLVETGVQFGDDFFVIGDDRLTDFNPGRATTLTSLRFGDVELVDEEWKVSGAGERPPEDTGTIEPTDAGLVVTTGASGVVRADAVGRDARSSRSSPRPGLSFGEPGPQVDSPGGDPNPAEIRAELPALPLVGAAGLFGDLRTALYASSPTVPAAQVTILAAADTPADVLAALVDEGGTVRTLDDISTSVERESGAVQAWMYAVMAGCCLLVALLALLAAGEPSARGVPPRRRLAARGRGADPRDPVRGARGAGAARRRGRGRRGRGRPARRPAAARRPDPGRRPGVRDPAGPGVVRAAGAGDRAGARRHRRPRRGSWPAHRPRADPSVDPARGGGDAMTGTLLGAVLRGIRSRALLSAGSVLLIALAIGSAVLGPVFQVAVTNSYVVTRLNDALRARPG